MEVYKKPGSKERLFEMFQGVIKEEINPVINHIFEALEKLKAGKPDLVVVDMMMPGMSGRELVEKIRKDSALKDLKLVFLTVARFSETGKKVLEELNVADYITKPFENEDLVKRLKKVLD